MDPSLEESARVAGSSNFQIAWRITLPIIRPALLAADAEFRPRDRELRYPGDHRAAGAHRSFYHQNLSRGDRRFPPNQNLAAAYGVSLLVDHHGVRLFLSPFDRALASAT